VRTRRRRERHDLQRQPDAAREQAVEQGLKGARNCVEVGLESRAQKICQDRNIAAGAEPLV